MFPRISNIKVDYCKAIVDQQSNVSALQYRIRRVFSSIKGR
jgi:hypothetical protein